MNHLMHDGVSHYFGGRIDIKINGAGPLVDLPVNPDVVLVPVTVVKLYRVIEGSDL